MNNQANISKDRRQFLKLAGAGVAATALSSPLLASTASVSVPSYLRDYADLYQKSPKDAAYAWFKAAEVGMFMHYGLYSILGGEYQGKPIKSGKNPVAEWAQLRGNIPLGEYAKLKDQFTATKFDADFITDLALESGMGYINLTTRHHDSFCLFDTKYTDFNSVNSPAKRDLVGELAEQCQQKGLGFFMYYSHGRDWKHAHAPTKQWNGTARPDYEYTETAYAELNDEMQHDIGLYAEFMANQVTELLTNYGPVAGIWLDGEGVLKSYAKKSQRPLESIVKEMRIPELYAMIRKLQPNALVSYKKGIEGSEDILAPERKVFGLENSGKMLEICTTLQAHSWGYNKYTEHRKSITEVMEIVEYCKKNNANLLMNTGPMGDGSLVAEEIELYREIGRRRRAARA